MADELQRALLLRDLELMGQPRNPNAVQPARAGLLDLGGIGQRLGLLNQIFNPVEAIGGSMRAGREMMAPNASGYDRLASLGDMLSGVAGVVAPVAAGVRAGAPAATALMEGLLGGSPTSQAAGDMARQFGVDESGALRLYQGSPHDFNAERLVRMPDGSTQYIVGRPDVLPDVPPGAEVLRDFPLGRQRMDKIGTGEGAQAYGYGLYGAENEGIARGYRDALSDAPGIRGILPEGQVFNDPSISATNRLPTAQGVVLERLNDYFQENVSRQGLTQGAISDALDKTKRNIKSRLVQRIMENPPDRQRQIREFGVDRNEQAYSSQLDYVQSLQNRIDELEPVSGSGRMYELEVNANPEDFLDWDLPLSEQPQILSLLGMPKIRSYATIFEEADSLMKAGDASVGRKNGWMENPEISARVNDLKKELNQTPSDMSVQNLLMQIGSDVPNPQGFNADRAMVAASDKLRQAGIPGIRYLDAGSRGAGDGSRNYVIFDENLINIVRKYGIAGAAAMLGVSTLDVEQAMAQGQQQPQGLLSGAQQ